MAGFRTPEVSRSQLVLWSHRLDDALPPDHPVRLLDELLGSAAFSATFGEWEATYDLSAGQPPYHPRDLAGLYLYGMLNRLRSSRQLESACYNRLDVIWLLSGQTPDHATIAAFVTRHGSMLRKLFRDVLVVCQRAGLVELQHVATDGTKIEADASKGSVRSAAKIKSWLGHVDERIAALQAEWEQNEKQERALFGDQASWAPRGQAPPAQRLVALQRQQARLKAALAELVRRQAESPEPIQAIASTTDPDSRSMPDKEGRVKPNYNAQLAVDAKMGIIVAESVSDAADDSGQLTPMLREVQANCGRKPLTVSADSQYNTGPELVQLEREQIIAYLPDAGTGSAPPADADQLAGSTGAAGAAQVEALAAARAGQTLSAAQWAALPHNRKARIEKPAFTYERTANVYRCPAGASLPVLRVSAVRKKGGRSLRTQYGFPSGRRHPPPPCASCAHATECCANPARGRTINRDQYEDHRERMRTRMNSDAGRAVYKRRRETVEPRFGQIKHGLGIRRFLHRGLEKVKTEWRLICTAVNVSVLLKHWKDVAPLL